MSHGIDKLKRVVWRLREYGRPVTGAEYRNAIWHEIGTDPRTVKEAKRKLRALKYIHMLRNGQWQVTTKDTE